MQLSHSAINDVNTLPADVQTNTNTPQNAATYATIANPSQLTIGKITAVVSGIGADLNKFLFSLTVKELEVDLAEVGSRLSSLVDPKVSSASRNLSVGNPDRPFVNFRASKCFNRQFDLHKLDR